MSKNYEIGGFGRSSMWEEIRANDKVSNTEYALVTVLAAAIAIMAGIAFYDVFLFH